MKPEKAAEILEERFPLARLPLVHLGPDWLPYIVPTEIPVLPWRIRIAIDWDDAAEVAKE
jgi:hypothetical protein